MDLLPELEVERMLLAMALMKMGESEANLQGGLQGVGDGGIAQNMSNLGPNLDMRTQFFIDSKQVMLVSDLTKEIVNTVTRIHLIRNKTSLTKTEVSWILATLKRGIEKFVPEENRQSFIRWLREQNLDTFSDDEM